MKTKQSEETQSFTNADIECGNKYDFIMKNVSNAKQPRGFSEPCPQGNTSLFIILNINQFVFIFKQTNTYNNL